MNGLDGRKKTNDKIKYTLNSVSKFSEFISFTLFHHAAVRKQKGNYQYLPLTATNLTKQQNYTVKQQNYTVKQQNYTVKQQQQLEQQQQHFVQQFHIAAKRLLNSLKKNMCFTLLFHVAVSKNCFPRYNRIKPIFAADCLSSFTRLDFLTRFSGKLRNRSEWN